MENKKSHIFKIPKLVVYLDNDFLYLYIDYFLLKIDIDYDVMSHSIKS